MEAGPLLGFAGLIAFIILIGVFASRVRQGYEETLRALGEPNGLAYSRVTSGVVGAGHRVVGTLDGRAFELRIEPVRNVLQENWVITLKRQLPDGFAAGKNGWLRRPSEGMTFVSTGDADFDKKVFVEARDPATVAGLITPAWREALGSLAGRNGLVYGGKVMFQKPGLDTKLEKLAERLTWLRDIAAKLDATG